MASFKHSELLQTLYTFTTIHTEEISLEASIDYVYFIREVNSEWLYGMRCKDGISGVFPKNYVCSVNTSWLMSDDKRFVAYRDSQNTETSLLLYKQGKSYLLHFNLIHQSHISLV